MRPVINSRKHYVQLSLGVTALGAITKLDIIKAVKVEDIAAASDVREGSVIKAVFVELWITSDDVTQSTSTITLEKKPASAPAMTAGQSALLDDYPNKKNVLYTTQGLVSPKTGSNPIPILRQWFKIPKGKQRFGLADQLVLNLHAVSDGINFCGFFTYKEYF